MKKQIDLINEIKDYRFFKMGEEDIVIFEKNTNLFKEQKNIEMIPELCSVLEDDVPCCAPCENVVKENFFGLYQEYIEEGEIKSSILQNKYSFFDKIYVNEIRIFLNGFAIVFITDEIKEKSCF